MPYRTKITKDDMIAELEESEIKQACLDYLQKHYKIFAKDRTDVEISHHSTTKKLIARIELPVLHQRDSARIL